MKTALLLVGAAALFASGPALAKHGHKHDKKVEVHKGRHGTVVEVRKGRHSKYYAYGRACPPGLRLRDGFCMPRGQYRKMYRIGQSYPRSYGSLWTYNQIPYDLRSRYDFDDDYRYYYSDGYLYRVDPRTMLIREVVNAIIR